jgi:hypothetical protein
MPRLPEGPRVRQQDRRLPDRKSGARDKLKCLGIPCDLKHAKPEALDSLGWELTVRGQSNLFWGPRFAA